MMEVYNMASIVKRGKKNYAVIYYEEKAKTVTRYGNPA